ncbi:MAG: hypothetical protein P9L95_06715 [Candidatus Tenebribacter mawsonii]|nr:hypothetical protein [Candidatus Tenebribacter mawsonii]
MKKLFLLLFTILASQLLGQISFTPPAPPVMPMNQNLYIPSNYNPEYRCEIYLKDGTMVDGESGIYKKAGGKFYLKIKKEKFIPCETDSIYVNQCTGIPKDDYWLFKTISGKLSVYNKYPKEELNKNSFVTKIKNEYTPYNKTNLLHEIKDHPEALSMYKKINTNVMVSHLLTWGGAGILLISYANLPPEGTDKEFSKLPQFKFILGGSFMFLAGLIGHISSDDTYYDVVKKYNE